MSYRCQICTDPAPPMQKLLKHTVLRPDGQIAREVAVCAECRACLDSGYSLDFVYRTRMPKSKPSKAVAALPSLAKHGDAPPVKPVVFK